MKRFSLDLKRRKLIAAGGLLAATVVLASAFLVGSGAIFTSSSANPSNVFTAGVLNHSNGKTRRHPHRQPHEADRRQDRHRDHQEHR